MKMSAHHPDTNATAGPATFPGCLSWPTSPLDPCQATCTVDDEMSSTSPHLSNRQIAQRKRREKECAQAQAGQPLHPTALNVTSTVDDDFSSTSPSLSNRQIGQRNRRQNERALAHAGQAVHPTAVNATSTVDDEIPSTSRSPSKRQIGQRKRRQNERALANARQPVHPISKRLMGQASSDDCPPPKHRKVHTEHCAQHPPSKRHIAQRISLDDGENTSSNLSPARKGVLACSRLLPLGLGARSSGSLR